VQSTALAVSRAFGVSLAIGGRNQPSECVRALGDVSREREMQPAQKTSHIYCFVAKEKPHI
jgi:hypothetical protein